MADGSRPSLAGRRVATPARTRFLSPGRVCLALAVVAALLAWTGIDPDLSARRAFTALIAAPTGDPAMALMHFSWWPRLCVALLCGGGLSLAGVLMQQVLRNPLAAPTTLGVATGANLALALASLYAPALLAGGRVGVALAGGALAMGLVFVLSWRHALAPVVVVLAGLVVNLYFSALDTVLLLFHPQSLASVLIWQAGSLTQTNWEVAAFLWPRLLGAGLVATLLLRPLAILQLGDANARGLGVSLKYMRLAGLTLAVFVTACVVSAVGVIGFIGLAAPAIVRLLGARRLGSRLIWSTLLGALLLAVTDLALQHGQDWLPTLLPTGAVTAALGAPLLLWLIPRLRMTDSEPAPATTPGRVLTRPGRLLMVLAVALVAAAAVALLIGRGLDGWSVIWPGADPANLQTLTWRWPRMLAAGASGVMLAMAGTVMQRVTGNPMASPEVLGISAGTAIGLIAVIFLWPGAGPLVMLGVGAAGAAASLAVLMLLNRASGFAPERVLLTGIAIAALFDALRILVLAGGDPRGSQVLAWISGSTYYVGPATATIAVLAAAVFMLTCLPFSRWLDLLPTGAPVSRALGLDVPASRVILLALASLATACATLIIGPLSFVGLLAPHLARLMGFGRARMHLLGAALIGALLMILADWLGRQILFPQDVPAGLMASLLGGAYFMWRLRRLR